MFTNDIPSREEFIATLSSEGADTAWAGMAYDHYQSLGWKDGQGMAIGSWKAYALKAWRKEQEKRSSVQSFQGKTASPANISKSSAGDTVEREKFLFVEKICKQCPNYLSNQNDGCQGLSVWSSTGTNVTFLCAYSDKPFYLWRKDPCIVSRKPTADDPRETVRFQSPDILAGGQRTDAPYEPVATVYRYIGIDGYDWDKVYLNTTPPLDHEMLERQSDTVKTFFKSFPADELQNAVETSKRQGFFR